MSPPVVYLPAYIGLFATLVLAVASNAYLDIQYGGFGVEVMVWATVYFFTLRVAWGQRGVVSEHGQSRQKLWLAIGMLMTLVLFLPMWGLPRGGLYALAALQASMNCVTVDRRTFMMAITVSAVMVMFATMHHRADWTMLFYLVPYLFAVVFTLVAEQVSRRVQEVQQDGRDSHAVGSQGISIVAAAATLLAVALILFALTPQVTWLSLKWKYGQLSNIGFLNSKEKGADGGTSESGGAEGGTEDAQRAAGAGGKEPGGDQDIAHGEAGQSLGDGYRESLGPQFNWPTLGEMREAAKRPGMPQWQSRTIRQAAELVEMTAVTFQPIKLGLDELKNDAKQWLQENRQDVLRAIFMMIILMLLIAAWILFREARLGLWLRSRWDYLRLGLLWHYPSGRAGADQYFRALERLLDVQGLARPSTMNTREYLSRLSRRYDFVEHEVTEIILLFEKTRYGDSNPSASELKQIRLHYRQIYYSVDLGMRA
jgi:Ca2+/Na+ antiporter